MGALLDGLRPKVASVVLHTEKEDRPVRVGKLIEEGVVAVEQKGGAGPKPVEQLELRFQDPLLGAQRLHMGHADFGDDSKGRGRRLRQAGDFPEIAHPHLQHRRLGGFVHLKHRQRQADFIIEIPLGL